MIGFAELWRGRTPRAPLEDKRGEMLGVSFASLFIKEEERLESDL